MVAGTVLVFVVGSRSHKGSDPEPDAPSRPHEEPWLEKADAAQLFGERGAIGPLFKDVELGGIAPPPRTRALIAEFARKHHVTIDLEIKERLLTAIHVEVSYSGCCGYEGADVLGLRLGRPVTESCCGCTQEWIDNWGIANEDGTYMRARVNVNKVSVTWQRTATAEQLLERADGLIGTDIAKVREAAGDGWFQVDSHHYRIDMPYPFNGGTYAHSRDDLGVSAAVEGGKITEVSFALRSYDDGNAASSVGSALRTRYGRARKDAEGVDTWRTANRVVTGGVDPARSFVTIAQR